MLPHSDTNSSGNIESSEDRSSLRDTLSSITQQIAEPKEKIRTDSENIHTIQEQDTVKLRIIPLMQLNLV